MDKPKYIIDKRVPHKKGFALIITLSVLAVIIALTGVLISYFDDVRRDAAYTKALIQGNLYYADIQKTFQRFKKRKSLYTTLYKFSVPLTTPDGRFSVTVRCSPLANGVNINWLGLGNNQQMVEQYNVAENIFEAIVQSYSLEDATRLKEMFLEEIGGKEKFVQKEQSRLRQKNGIISYEQFEGILNRYQLEVDDPNVSRISWKKFFVFNEVEKNPKSNVIDGDYISAELISLLFDIDLQVTKEWYGDPEKGSLKSFVNENNSGAYVARKNILVKDFLAMSQCDVTYTYAGDRFKFNFVDIQGEVKNFEFYGKQ